MATNEGVINRSADDGRYIADADPQNVLEPPTDGAWVLFHTYYILTNCEYDSINS